MDEYLEDTLLEGEKKTSNLPTNIFDNHFIDNLMEDLIDMEEEIKEQTYQNEIKFDSLNSFTSSQDRNISYQYPSKGATYIEQTPFKKKELLEWLKNTQEKIKEARNSFSKEQENHFVIKAFAIHIHHLRINDKFKKNSKKEKKEKVLEEFISLMKANKIFLDFNQIKNLKKAFEIEESKDIFSKNLKEELSEEVEKLARARKMEYNRNFSRQSYKESTSRDKKLEYLKRYRNDPRIKSHRKEYMKEYYKNPDHKKTWLEYIKKYRENPTYKDKRKKYDMKYSNNPH